MNKKFFYQLALPIFLLVNVFLQASHQWEPFANLNSGVGSIAFEKIVCDGNGNGAAIWYDAGGATGWVTYRSSNSAVWETPYPFSTNGQKNYVDITMDQLGNVSVFYTFDNTAGGSNNQLYSFYRPSTGTWGPSTLLYSTPALSDQIFDITCSSSSQNTQAIVAWTEGTSTVKSCYRAGTTWSSYLLVASGTVSPAIPPIVHMLPNGNAEIAMSINPGTADIYSSYTTTPGGSWLVTPQATGIGSVAFDFDINSSGKAVILAVPGGGLSFVTKSTIGGAWQGPYPLLVSTPVVNPRVGLSDSDQIIGIWSDNGMITYGIGSVGATTLSTQVIEQGTSPVVDVSPAGYFLLGWIATGGNLKTWLGSGTTLEPSYIVLDSVTSSGLFWNVCVGDNYMGWAI